MGLASKEDRELGYDVAARLTIANASEMTKDGRARIATWLRRQADKFESEGDNYAKRFVAKYWFKI
jgi:hypothetical protein